LPAYCSFWWRQYHLVVLKFSFSLSLSLSLQSCEEPRFVICLLHFLAALRIVGSVLDFVSITALLLASLLVSDPEVSSGSPIVVPGFSRYTKMHASNLLKAVLKPRSLSSTTSGRKQSLVTPQNEVTTKGKRISSLDHSLPSATSVIARKPSHSSSPPVKVTCLCSPTNHPGSFRCRHHRTGNPLGSASASSSKTSGASSRVPAADSRQAAHMIRANGMHNLPSLPGPPPSSLARSPLGRTSRLNPMVASGEAERDIVIPFVNE
jgi:hypothetical protein